MRLPTQATIFRNDVKEKRSPIFDSSALDFFGNQFALQKMIEKIVEKIEQNNTFKDDVSDKELILLTRL